jgi:hypothetical protein
VKYKEERKKAEKETWPNLFDEVVAEDGKEE